VTESIDLLTLDEVASRLGVPVKRVQQMLRDHALAAATDEGGTRRVPADFLVPAEDRGTEVVKGLSGVLTLLSDVGYNDAESVRWLFAADDSLPGTPIDALRTGRGTEVKRRAQALGF
jgi:excisionase family DNA binding protein